MNVLVCARLKLLDVPDEPAKRILLQAKADLVLTEFSGCLPSMARVPRKISWRLADSARSAIVQRDATCDSSPLTQPTKRAFIPSVERISLNAATLVVSLPQASSRMY